MRLCLAFGAVLAGCIVTESVPEPGFPAPEDPNRGFEAACEAAGYDRALGCVLACGAGASPVLAVEQSILRHVGSAARYTPEAGDAFDARCGTATWRQCEPNRFGGSGCVEVERPYCVECRPDGVAMAGDDADAHPTIPAAAVRTSVIPSMARGEFRGEPGSCLAGCVAAVTRAPCGDCGEDEGCLETGFGRDVCHPRGVGEIGSVCEGDQACRSLSCDPEASRCD